MKHTPLGLFCEGPATWAAAAAFFHFSSRAAFENWGLAVDRRLRSNFLLLISDKESLVTSPKAAKNSFFYKEKKLAKIKFM